MDFMRFILVIACLSPLFILLAIRGIGVIDFEVYFPTFITLAILPNLYLWFRMWQARKANDRKRIRVHSITDNREHLLTYLFAMLMPLFQGAVNTPNDLYSGLCALLFVIYIFMHMDLYYMNVWLALFCRYRVLTIKGDPATGGVPHVLITKRPTFSPNQDITPLRITDFLLLDN